MKINIYSDNNVNTIHSKNNILLSDALILAGYCFDMPCGGKKSCGKCKVKVKGNLSYISQTEHKFLSTNEINNNIRLACMTKANGDCDIYLSHHENAVTNFGSIPSFELNPIFEKYGIAIDIGTTTVAFYLYNNKGILIDKKSTWNPQSKFGADVISRMERQINTDINMSEVICDNIRTEIVNLVSQNEVSVCDIDGVVITGNTVMIYFLLGYNVKRLCEYPFFQKHYFGKYYSELCCKIGLQSECKIYIPPSISPFVGSDIVCSALASSMSEDRCSLLIDVGTNGEIVMYKDKKYYVCSTSAGPAFEGAGIYNGSYAKSGAISSVYIKNGLIAYDTISDVKAKSICGTGLIDAVSLFIKMGIITRSGQIYLDSDYEEYLTIKNDENAIELGDSNLVITQKDIRNIQLAKSAIYSGVISLMKYANITFDEIKKFYIAGGFGSYINKESASFIGLYPKELNDRYNAIGNGAGIGASLCLLNKNNIDKCILIAKNSVAIELANDSVFNEEFINNINF